MNAVGKGSPLFCSAAEGLSKALHQEKRYSEAFDALLESFEVHAKVRKQVKGLEWKGF